MYDLTLFAVPRPFEGIYDAIQRNAIGSWLEMDVEVLLLHEPGSNVPDVARELGLPAYEIAISAEGTPMLDSIFQTAFARIDTPLSCYVNADIIVLGPLHRAAALCAQRMKRFLMVGQRVDLSLASVPVNLRDPEWRAQLEHFVQEGVLHAPCGIDYFASSGNVWGDIPPFALGRAAWDNWLVARALRTGVPVVDATAYVTVVHQAHPVPFGIRDWPECVNNYRLLAQLGDGGSAVTHAPWVMATNGEIHHRGG